MRVQDIMSRRPVTVGLDTTAAAALRLLGSHHVTALPVVDRSTRIVGIVSEADLIPGRVPADPVLGGAHDAPPVRGRGPEASVADVMSRLIVVVHPETDLAENGPREDKRADAFLKQVSKLKRLDGERRQVAAPAVCRHAGKDPDHCGRSGHRHLRLPRPHLPWRRRLHPRGPEEP